MRFALLLRSMGCQAAASIPTLAAVFFVGAALSALTPRVVAAQSVLPGTPRPGQLLRWVTIDGQAGRGRMLGSFDVSSEQIAYRPAFRYCTQFNPCADQSLDLGAVRDMEVRIGRHTRRGAAIGGTVGCVVGLLLSFAVAGLDDTGAGDFELYVIPTGFLTAVGAGVGAIFGSKSEIWRPVRLSE